MPETHYKPKPKEVVAVRPVVTVILLIMCFVSLYQVVTLGQPWVWHHGFSNVQFAHFWPDHKYWEVVQMMFWATFTPFNIWQSLADIYFLWVFGSAIEQRLGQKHYAMVVLLSIIGSWLMVGFETMSANTTCYLGSALLTCGIIGAYLNFFPEKKINPVGTLGRRYQIFRNERDPDLAERFGVSPWLIISLFVVYQTGLHYYLSHLKTAISYDSMPLMSALGTLALGSIVCRIIVTMTTANLQGDPLRRLALQKYQQLKALDLTHEQSIEGASRLLSIPSDQVKEWVSKGVLPHQLNQ